MSTASRISRKATQPQKQGAGDVLPALVESRDVKRVQDAVAANYDMFVSETYAADLIKFVDATNARIAELEAQVQELTNARA